MLRKLKRWLIIRLAGDTLVILNATILFKHYPILANEENHPIIEKTNMQKFEKETPFRVYASDIFSIKDDEMCIKEEYQEIYNGIIKELNAEDKSV